jgi:hypothetical protein
MGLRDEPARIASALLDANLRSAPGNVGPHDRIGDIRHVVLVDEPGVDTGGGVPLFAWRVQIGHQDLIDHRLERIQLRAPGRVGRTLGGPRRLHRRFHGAPAHMVAALQLAFRHPGPGVPPDRGIQLDAGLALRHQVTAGAGLQGPDGPDRVW